MTLESACVALSAIAADNKTFRITTDRSNDELQSSIGHLGLLQPLLVADMSQGLILISGFRRWAALKALGHSQVDVRVTDAVPAVCAQMAIAENASQRPLNLVEQGRAVALLRRFLVTDDDFAHAARLAGLPANPTHLNNLDQLQALPWSVQEAVLADTVALPVALALARYDRATAVALARLLRELKLSLSKQRELILLLQEIAAREDLSVRQVLATAPLQKIIGNTDWDHPHKARQIRTYLKQRRYPHLSQAQQAMQSKLNALALAPGIRLEPPKHFEGRTFALALRFDTLRELQEHHKSLQRLFHDPIFKALLE